MSAMLSTTNKTVLDFFESGYTDLSFDEFLLNSIDLHAHLAILMDSDTPPPSHIIRANAILNTKKTPIMTNSSAIIVKKNQNSCDMPKVLQSVKSPIAIDNGGTLSSIPPDKSINLVQTNLTQNFSQQSDPILVNIHTELAKINNKFIVSSNKGQISENIIYNDLKIKLPHASIIFNRHTPHSADILIDRSGHVKIIIENKDWVRPVTSTEVDKFIRDVEATGHSGIFISQASSITNINSFYFKIINNNNIAMFIGDCNYNCDTIIIAIHIIDQLLIQIQNITSEYDASTIIINHQKVPEIVLELQNFMIKKQQLITLTQNMQKNIEELQIPTITDLFKITQPKIKSDFICHNCGRILKSKGGLTIHINSCIIKNPPAPVKSTKNN